MSVVVDTNVIIDIAEADPIWKPWSLSQLSMALADGPALICDIVFAELCSQYASVGEVEAVLATLGLTLQPLRKPALFRAAQAFAAYRRSGGTKDNVLPDFFIGAQAMDLGVPLLTRDTRRYRSYFPSLELIAPETPGIG
jgi:predicted nucleic acid-binding protein